MFGFGEGLFGEIMMNEIFGRIALTLLAFGLAACETPNGNNFSQASYACTNCETALAFKEQLRSVTPENFDSGGAISRQFQLNPETYFSMATISRIVEPRELPVSSSRSIADHTITLNGEKMRFEDYVANDPLLDGVIVLHDNEIVFEAYPNMNSWDRHFAWSVTKVVTSTAIAILAEQGRIDMATPVEEYVPELAETAWAGIAVQNIADMASGIDCLDSDGYQDKTTCVYQHEESLGIVAATGREIGFLDHLRSMKSKSAPGLETEYVSANTNMLMLVIEAVTDKPYHKVVEELIWNSVGAEADAMMAISREGYAYASGGLHARLRDIARFGQIYSRSDSFSLLSSSMIEGIQSSGGQLAPLAQDMAGSVFGADVPSRSGWQWDFIWADGGMFKGGYLGQGLYVDPGRKLVIAWFGTGLNFSETTNAMLPVSRQVAQSVKP